MILRSHYNHTKGTSKSDTHVKVRDVQTSLEITGIVAVFTPSNRECKGYLRDNSGTTQAVTICNS